MANSLNIVNNFTASINGNTYTGHQGPISSVLTDAYSITVTGLGKFIASELASLGSITLYDDSADTPTDFTYFYLICDQTMYLQFITATDNVTFKIAANIPFSFGGFNSVLPVSSSTIKITGGATPGTSDIKKIVLANPTSGTTCNYTFFVGA